MLKSSVVGISLLVVLMVQDASCQYYRYPASTFPLHQFSYQAPLHFYPGLVPASAYQSNLVRHQTPFRNSKVSPLLSTFLTRTGINTPGYGSGVIVV